MKTHLYLLLLAAGISAAPQMSSMAELLTLLQQMCEVKTKDIQNLRIETPNNIDGKCDTERRSTTIFIKKLKTFVRKVLKTTRLES